MQCHVCEFNKNVYFYNILKMGSLQSNKNSNITKLIPDKFKGKKFHKYWNLNVDQIFEFFVLKLIELDCENTFQTFNQLGNLIFNDHDSDELRKILTEYNTYFDTIGVKRRLKIRKVFDEHPWIWGIKDTNNNIKLIEQLIKAIDDEIYEAKRLNIKLLTIDKIESVTTVQTGKKLFIYSAELILEDDDLFSISEGERIEIILLGNSYVYATVLDYNFKSAVLSFQTTTNIDTKTARIKISNIFLLYRLKDFISTIQEGDTLFWKFIKKEQFDNKINAPIKPYLGKLDDSQQWNVYNCINQHITYLWGPPGTGKSFTLAYLLLNLLQLNQKTIVCSIANIAVDVLLRKLIETLEQSGEIGRSILKTKQIMRLGYSQSDDIRQIPYLKFESPLLVDISRELLTIKQEIDLLFENKTENENDKKILILKSKRDELKRDYDLEVRRILANADMVFLTSSKFIIDEGLKGIEFDNLVIDEGSMMSFPHLLPLAVNIKQRIVISGDFQQLGPIAMSKSTLSQKWLHKDLFALLGNSKQEIISSKFVSMINTQRRSASAIVELINKEFYENKLSTVYSENHMLAIRAGIHSSNIKFINLEGNANNKVDYSKARSRYNSYSRKIVYNFLDIVNEKNAAFKMKVGIICPYRQQVNDYKKELSSKKYDFSITVGTIHTFQGSECDIIVWDFVDAPNQSIGKIYKGEEGERLVNVAISRAKSLIVLVGDRSVFNVCSGRETVSYSVKKIISEAWKIHLKQT